jgi:hypothetical protein
VLHGGPTSVGEGTTLTNSSEPEASLEEDPHEIPCILYLSLPFSNLMHEKK